MPNWIYHVMLRGKCHIIIAAIQRFEFTSEAVWKAAKTFLAVRQGIDIGSSKGGVNSKLYLCSDILCPQLLENLRTL
jgi:hypothetical protein